jgi:hypothetical protein
MVGEGTAPRWPIGWWKVELYTPSLFCESFSIKNSLLGEPRGPASTTSEIGKAVGDALPRVHRVSSVGSTMQKASREGGAPVAVAPEMV